MYRDETGWFYRVDENADEKPPQANPNGKEASQRPVDELIKKFLAACPGRHTLRQIVQGCGAAWPKDKTRFNDALQRRLVKRGEVIRHEPDVDAGYPEITYSHKG